MKGFWCQLRNYGKLCIIAPLLLTGRLGQNQRQVQDHRQDSSSNSALAACRSDVSKPSVNQL